MESYLISQGDVSTDHYLALLHNVISIMSSMIRKIICASAMELSFLKISV